MLRNPKRRKRILLLLTGAVVLAAAGGATYWVRQVQLDRRSLSARDAGRAALELGDYRAALDGLGRYLQRFGERGATGEDYYLYARARRAVELPNGKHIPAAISALRKSLELDPTSRDAQDELLARYLESGFATEALELVDRMLAADPNDLETLTTKCDVLEARRQFVEALAAADELNRRSGDAVTGYFRALRLRARMQTSRDDIRSWVDGVVAEHGGDPCFELLRAAALAHEGAVEEASQSLDKIMGTCTSLDDSSFVALLVGELDVAERFADSLDVLDRAASLEDETLRVELLRRLWYAGRASDIPAHRDRWTNSATRDQPEVLALTALSLAALGRGDDAAQLRRQLAQRSDAPGRAWSALAAQGASTSSVPSSTVGGLARSFAAVPRSAVLQQALGDAYAAVGETDLAFEAWTEAAALARSWSVPLRRIAETLMATGRGHLAPSVAKAAVRRAPRHGPTVMTYVRATAQDREELGPAEERRLLETVRELHDDVPAAREDVLPVYVDLLSRVDRDAAEQRLRAVLTDVDSVGESTLLRLAQIARDAGIELERQLFELSESLHGPSPRLALAVALARSERDGPAAGLRTLDEMRGRAAGGAPELHWEMVRAGYLDAVRLPGAGEQWLTMAEANPAVLEPQLGALASAAAWSDRDAITRIIERVRTLTGETGVTWRIARARWLLGAPASTDGEVAEAASILNDVTRSAPRSVPARLLLAQALERLENLGGAEEQLQIAGDLAPQNPALALELARLAQLQGQADRARGHVNRALRTEDLAPEHVERAAFLLAVQGDVRTGVDLLEPLVGERRARRDGQLLLAQLYARLGESRRALAICDRLMARADVAVIELAAGINASRGERMQARAVLGRLNDIVTTPGDRELVLARFAAAWEGPTVAAARFRAAVAAAPQRERVWLEFLGFAITNGDVASFDSVLDDPRAAALEPVQFLVGARDACTAALADERLQGLVLEALSATTERPALIEAIHLTGGARSGSASGSAAREDTARAVRKLAAAHVRLLSLQLLAAELSAEVGDLRRACAVTKRAAAQFPNSVAAARQSAALLARSDRWDEALSAGLAWRDRTAGSRIGAELFVADALTRVGRARDAVASLQRLVPRALEAGEAGEPVLLLHAVALVQSGEPERAEDSLAQLAAASPDWATRALRVGVERFGGADEAAAWLRMLAARVEPGDSERRLAVARAWGGAWERFREPELLAAAQAELRALTAAANASAESFFVSATLAFQSGDLTAAESGYAAALDRDPEFASARNNLAMLLADSGRAAEAVAEAERVVGEVPGNAECLDTLAYALRRADRPEEAAARLREAVALEPSKLLWRVNLAEVLGASGQEQGAGEALMRIEQLIEQGASLEGGLRGRVEALREELR